MLLSHILVGIVIYYKGINDELLKLVKEKVFISHSFAEKLTKKRALCLLYLWKNKYRSMIH